MSSIASDIDLSVEERQQIYENLDKFEVAWKAIDSLLMFMIKLGLYTCHGGTRSGFVSRMGYGRR